MSEIIDGMSGMKDGMKDEMSEMKDEMSGIKDGMSEMNEKLNSMEGILTQTKDATGMLFMYNYILTIDFLIRKLLLYHMINNFFVLFPQPLFFSLILLTKFICSSGGYNELKQRLIQYRDVSRNRL
jgi:hypothetical protein